MAEIQVEEGFDMDRILKIFLVCAAGGGIGTAFANHFHQHWWLGLLIGAFVGYLGFELEKIPDAARTAWRATINHKINWVEIRALCAIFVATFSLLASLCIGMGIVLGLQHMPDVVEGSIAAFCIVYIAYTITFTVLCFLIPGVMTDMIENESLYWHVTRTYNPLSICFVVLPRSAVKVVMKLPIALIWAGRCILSIMRLAVDSAITIAKMLVMVFRLIHSDLRLLCAVDACFGAWIGHLAGNVAIGAMVGGLSGVANYYFISVLWLKLAPVREPVEL